ncbi:hypothetical protein P4H65_05815 [Paenibacillus chitinolyticus]|uniref:hypothetical protein n=1 Tax=Paenibacillus chitinolyticus TaxID=79263 RepID=UPI002DBE3C9A|nr:hypothetical protein [Paenibacillus chitinolyticus]MEC0245311.1 hypothetical protein [Paenibacillus chitinolyticus]
MITEAAMESKKKYGTGSTLLSILGVLTLVGSYLISENPAGGESAGIRLLFYTAIGSLAASLVLGYAGMLKEERGFLKFAAAGSIFLVAGALIAALLLMLFTGFRET